MRINSVAMFLASISLIVVVLSVGLLASSSSMVVIHHSSIPNPQQFGAGTFSAELNETNPRANISLVTGQLRIESINTSGNPISLWIHADSEMVLSYGNISGQEMSPFVYPESAAMYQTSLFNITFVRQEVDTVVIIYYTLYSWTSHGDLWTAEVDPMFYPTIDSGKLLLLLSTVIWLVGVLLVGRGGLEGYRNEIRFFMLVSFFLPSFYANNGGLEVVITLSWFFELQSGIWSSSRVVGNQFILYPFPDWTLIPYGQILWISLLLSLEFWRCQRARRLVPRALIASHLALLLFMFSAIALKIGEFALVMPIPLISIAGVYWLFREWQSTHSLNPSIHNASIGNQ